MTERTYEAELEGIENRRGEREMLRNILGPKLKVAEIRLGTKKEFYK